MWTSHVPPGHVAHGTSYVAHRTQHVARGTCYVRAYDERKQINFTIVPDDRDDLPRTYANFCAISHTPFDFTLAFCEVLPLSERDIQGAEADHVVRAPVRSKIVVPLQVVPNLIAALQEHMRVFSESTGAQWDKGPVH